MRANWIKIWEREYNLHRMSQVMESLMTSYAEKVIGFRRRLIMSLKKKWK